MSARSNENFNWQCKALPLPLFVPSSFNFFSHSLSISLSIYSSLPWAFFLSLALSFPHSIPLWAVLNLLWVLLFAVFSTSPIATVIDTQFSSFSEVSGFPPYLLSIVAFLSLSSSQPSPSPLFPLSLFFLFSSFMVYLLLLAWCSSGLHCVEIWTVTKCSICGREGCCWLLSFMCESILVLSGSWIYCLQGASEEKLGKAEVIKRSVWRLGMSRQWYGTDVTHVFMWV